MKVELFWPWRLFIPISLLLRGVPWGPEDIWIMEGLWLFLLFELELFTNKGEQLKCLSAVSTNSTWDLPIKSKVLLAVHFDKIFCRIWHVFASQRQLIRTDVFAEKTEWASQKNGKSCIWAMCWWLPICITHSTWSSNGSPKPPSVLEIQEQPSNHDCSDKSEKHRACFQLRVPNSRLRSLKKLTWCSSSVGLTTANLFRPQSGVLGNIWRGSTETVLLVSFEGKLIHHVCETHQALRIELEDTFTWLLWETLWNNVSRSCVHNLEILDENKCSGNTKIKFGAEIVL